MSRVKAVGVSSGPRNIMISYTVVKGGQLPQCPRRGTCRLDDAKRLLDAGSANQAVTGCRWRRLVADTSEGLIPEPRLPAL